MFKVMDLYTLTRLSKDFDLLINKGYYSLSLISFILIVCIPIIILLIKTIYNKTISYYLLLRIITIIFLIFFSFYIIK
jgi:hypothetical protein